MPCHLIRPDSDQSYDSTLPSIFLAGPIQGSPPWNERLIAALWDLNINIFDPRRTSMDNFVYDEQVAWETAHLIKADIISFSFVTPGCDIPGRSYAQTSRFELGECLARAYYASADQKVVVFADPEYPGAANGFPGTRYFRYKVEHEYPEYADFFDDWDDYVACLKKGLLERQASV